MKIISKFKDYYDYLQGIYGVDEKLILDRRKFIKPNKFTSNFDKVTLFICDYQIEGIYLNNEWLYGDEIAPYALPPKKYYYGIEYKSYWFIHNSEKPHNPHKVLKYSKLLNLSPNDNFKFPILIQIDEELRFNPILKDYSIHKVFSPEQMWIMLSNWLSKPKDILNNQTDKEKIIAAGFDLRTSFRNIK